MGGRASQFESKLLHAGFGLRYNFTVGYCFNVSLPDCAPVGLFNMDLVELEYLKIVLSVLLGFNYISWSPLSTDL
jgi:hypothetical protein